MVVETESAVYVFEFKLDGTVEEALAQIDSNLKNNGTKTNGL